MKLLIKIIGAAESSQPILHEYGGRTYPFVWDKKLREQVYEPKNQAEIDAIFGVPARFSPWQFAPLVISDAAGATKGQDMRVIPPLVNPRSYEGKHVPELVDLCYHNGFEPQGPETIENLKGQLNAYFTGRVWNAKESEAKAEQLRQARIAKVEKLKAETAKAVANVPAAPPALVDV